MKVLTIISVLLLATLSLAIGQVKADPVYVLDKIYVGDPTIYCGASPFPDWLPKPFPTTLTRECSLEKPGLNVSSAMTLNFTYPAVITLQNPGTFEATAILTFSHLNNNYDSGAFLELELEGDHRLPTPDCHEKVDNWKELPRGQQFSNETLELNAFCAFDSYWGWGDDPVFEFQVNSTISDVSQHFYLWLYYKEATDQGPFTLNVNKSGSCSGTVTSIRPGINCDRDYTDCNQSYPLGTQVILTASPDLGCLSQWRWTRSDGGHCNDNSDCEVNMYQDTTVSAWFDKPKLCVDTSGSSGSGYVSADRGNLFCYPPLEDCCWLYDTYTLVTLTAVPADGSIFAGWSGGYCTGRGKCEVSMDENHSISAKFIHFAPGFMNILLEK